MPVTATAPVPASAALPETEWRRDGYRHHLWRGSEQLATIALGRPNEWDGVYRWCVPAAGSSALSGLAPSLRQARRAVVEALQAGAVRDLFECTVPRPPVTAATAEELPASLPPIDRDLALLGGGVDLILPLGSILAMAQAVPALRPAAAAQLRSFVPSRKNLHDLRQAIPFPANPRVMSRDPQRWLLEHGLAHGITGMLVRALTLPPRRVLLQHRQRDNEPWQRWFYAGDVTQALQQARQWVATVHGNHLRGEAAA